MDDPQPIPIQLRAAREVFTTWDGFLTFGFGSGLLPKAPGTMGTLAAVPFVFALKSLDGAAYLLAILLLFAFGVWICNRVGQRLGVEDYGGIVWDEMVGYWIVMAFVPAEFPWLVAGFALFRFFDILKPWPIGLVEAQFSGGLGIMLDDVLAAVYAMVLLEGLHRLLGA